MTCSWRDRGSRRGYSLVELLVVLGVITVLILTAFPAVFGRNDRLLLDSSANMIRQIIIDARVRSIAPSNTNDGQAAQFYQVVFETFNKDRDKLTVEGGIQTNRVSLERGKFLCGSGAFQGGLTPLRKLRLPRNIYISKFYPSNQSANNPKAAIRFIVGQRGFRCGSHDNPAFNSLGVFDFGWSGSNDIGSSQSADRTTARYLAIELSSQKISEKRYVFVDRFTSEVIVSRTDIQGYFVPEPDTFAPKWRDTSDSSFTVSISCRSADSTISLFYRRAEDRYDEENTDPNLAVYYDLSWEVSSFGLLPLEQRYFYDLRSDTVSYVFVTTAYSIANQPALLRFRIVAYDEWGRAQGDVENAELRPRDKVFSNLGCGNRSADETDQFKDRSQDTPLGNYSGCEVAEIRSGHKFWFERLARVFLVSSARAREPNNRDCPDTGGGPIL